MLKRTACAGTAWEVIEQMPYFAAVFAGAISVLAAYTGTLAIIDHWFPDRMPTPALSGVVPTDEKLRFLRERRSEDMANPPDILAIGSSVAWMHLDGSVIEGTDGRFLNGATAHLMMNQTRAFSHFYLEMYDNISTVIMVTATPDYRDCSETSDWILDRQDAVHYVNDSRPTPVFLLRYFAPGRYLRQVVSRDQTLQPYAPSSYWHDPWGTTPVLNEEIAVDYDLRYGEIVMDPACFDALELMTQDLADRDIDFHIVLSPVNPRYAAQHPTSDANATLIVDRARALGVNVIDLHDDPRFAASDFWDAFHLQWPAAQRMSEIVAQTIAMAPAQVSPVAVPVAHHSGG